MVTSMLLQTMAKSTLHRPNDLMEEGVYAAYPLGVTDPPKAETRRTGHS